MGGVNAVLNCIHLFVMPLFVMISGYLTKKQSSGKFWFAELSLGITLCVFEVINAVLKLAIFHSFIPLLQPYWTLWYIFCLIIWRMIVQFTPVSILQNKEAVLATSFILCFIAPFVPLGYVLSFQRIFSFLPFFMIGFYMNENDLTQLRKINITIPVIIVNLCMFVIVWLSRYDIPILKILRGAENYGQFAMCTSNVILYKLLLFSMSLLSSLSILSIIRWSSKFTSDEGRKSILYYLYHGLIIEFLLVPLFKHLGIEESSIIGLASTILCITICYLISKSKISVIVAEPCKHFKKNNYDNRLHNRCL